MTGSGANQKEKATSILWIKCGEKFSRNYNLKSHIQRHHPEADVASLVDSRLCQCQLFPFKCYYVNALRQHLSEEHGLFFRTVHITFNSYSGEANFATWTDLHNVSPPTCSDFDMLKFGRAQVRATSFSFDHCQCKSSQIREIKNLCRLVMNCGSFGVGFTLCFSPGLLPRS